MNYRNKIQSVYNVFNNIKSFEFVKPQYFKSNNCDEYIRKSFSNPPVFDLCIGVSVLGIYIHKNSIEFYSHENGMFVCDELSTEVEVKEDFFQLITIDDYQDLTFEDIMVCKKVFEYFQFWTAQE